MHDKGIVDVFYIDGNNNPADIFTKNLGAVKFLKFRSQLGLHFRESSAASSAYSACVPKWLLSKGEC